MFLPTQLAGIKWCILVIYVPIRQIKKKVFVFSLCNFYLPPPSDLQSCCMSHWSPLVLHTGRFPLIHLRGKLREIWLFLSVFNSYIFLFTFLQQVQDGRLLLQMFRIQVTADVWEGGAVLLGQTLCFHDSWQQQRLHRKKKINLK